MKLISNFLMTITLLATLMACKREYVKEPLALPKIKQAKVVKLSPTKEPIPIYASGKITALESMKLSFKTGGYVQRITVEAGQTVYKGQVLATLNTSEIDAQVEQAQVNVNKLKRDLGRFRRLYQDSAATLQSVQDIETGLKVAESDLVIASFNQAHSEITSPVTGRVQLKMAEENELVNPGQPIVVISSKQEGMSLNAGLADRDVVKLKLGDRARLFFDAYPSLEGEARITEIAAEGHPVTGTFEVELTIENFPYELKSGFFARAAILPTEQSPYFRVPMHAMVSGGDDHVMVYVPDENKAKSRILKPDYINNEYFTVAAKSSNETMTVLTDGAAYLNEGESFQSID